MQPPSYAVFSFLWLMTATLSDTTLTDNRWQDSVTQGHNQSDTGQHDRPIVSSWDDYSLISVCDNKEEGYTNMGSLHSFTDDLSGSIKQDVLYSTLYAQIEASTRYGRTDHYDLWYDEYSRTLKSIGWKMESFHFNNYNPASLTYSIMEVVKSVLAPHCLDVQKKVALELFEAYQTLADYDEKVHTFVTNACHNDSGDIHDMSGNFQILPAVASGSGSAVTVFGAFYFEASVKVYRFLGFTWKHTDIRLKSAIQIGILDDSSYSVHRSSVAKKLGYKIKEFIKEVPL